MELLLYQILEYAQEMPSDKKVQNVLSAFYVQILCLQGMGFLYKGFSYLIKRQTGSGIYFVQRSSGTSNISTNCAKLKEDKLRLKYHLNATRHNNNVYKSIVQQLTLDNQTATERYIQSLEKTKAMENEIDALKIQSNNCEIVNHTFYSLVAENENLKSVLNTQIGIVSIRSNSSWPKTGSF